MDRFFVLQNKCDLAPRIVWQRAQDLVCTPIHKCSNCFSTRTIALIKSLQTFAGNTGPGRETFDLSLELGLIAREHASTANREGTRILLTFHVQEGKYFIGHLLRKSSERSPLAANERIDREA